MLGGLLVERAQFLSIQRHPIPILNRGKNPEMPQICANSAGNKHKIYFLGFKDKTVNPFYICRPI